MAVIPVKFKRKTTSGAPSAGQLQVGEIVKVYPDNVAYTKHTNGVVKRIKGAQGPQGVQGPPGNDVYC